MEKQSVLLHKESALYFNFLEIFTGPSVQRDLLRLQDLLSTGYQGLNLSSVQDLRIVLNFEKCQWFEIFPLAQLLNILCAQPEPKPELHIIGPCIKILPWMHKYLSGIRRKLRSSDLTEEETQILENKIAWHSEQLPNMRARAGSFLVGWGVFDLLEEHYARCYWYASRDESMALIDLRALYQFGYGTTFPTTAPSSDRVWPFTLVYRDEQHEMLDRVNGEELIAGALRKYAGSEVIANGTASNVFLFEPFENVFLHAFKEKKKSDSAIVAMRVNDWMYRQEGELAPKGQWLLRKLPIWQSRYIESLGAKGFTSFMEIIISDRGLGIPYTIGESFSRDEAYIRERGISFDPQFLQTYRGAWEAIRYSFEAQSTQRTESAPGIRGLAWVREKIAQVGGLIQVLSNGVNYVIADYGSGFNGINLEESMESDSLEHEKTFLRGTFIRLMYPLKERPRVTLDRRPRWGRKRANPTLFTEPGRVTIQPFALPDILRGDIPQEQGTTTVIIPPMADGQPNSFNKEAWDTYFNFITETLGINKRQMGAIDFDHKLATRASLEFMFESFLEHEELHGRLMAINLTRHIVCRLDTVSAIQRLQEEKVLFPLLENQLRMYWAGASVEAESRLLRYFQLGSSSHLSRISEYAQRNPGFFIIENSIPVEMSFGIEDIESVIRKLLGESLKKSLESRGAIHIGRYVMPLSGKTVSTYVEPHQIFVDSKIASFLCEHLAALLRWRYGRLETVIQSGLRVLTATRIGRDIAMRMPEAYRQKNFVYFDYHLIRPDKPRLMKYLSGHDVVIVVDIITTGSQVEELIRVCEEAGSNVVGIVSFIDFRSEDEDEDKKFISRSGSLIEHLTFWREPQTVSEPEPGDKYVDKQTLSISPIEISEREVEKTGIALLSKDKGVRLLEDAQAIHYGHYDLFGRHYGFAINFGRLFTTSSPQRDEIIRACENTILKKQANGCSTAIVLYPDLSSVHILQGAIERRQRIRTLLQEGKLRFVEARRGTRARGRRYWLTQLEVDNLKEWAKVNHPEGYSVLLLNDGASSGETLLALLDLARQLDPQDVITLVLVNRMPHLRTYHHSEIEKFAWATNKFASLIHLNIPVYKRENCPMCHERAELMRDLQHAREEWFKEKIRMRLDQLYMITALHPQDLPDEPLGSLGSEIPTFSWENPDILPGSRQSVISRALSVCTAMNDGVPITEILAEVSENPNDDLWRLNIIEIGRRVDLHQAQRAEGYIRDVLIKAVGGQNQNRRIAALEALRYLRPEALLPVMSVIIDAALQNGDSDELTTELLLLMRRVFSYRHLAIPSGFEVELSVNALLDNATAKAKPNTSWRKALDNLNQEWGVGPEPRFNLPTFIMRLEGFLMTLRRPRHQLLYKLSEYIADYRDDNDIVVQGVLDDAVRAGSLAIGFASLLKEDGRLVDQELVEKAQKACTLARELRILVLARMYDSQQTRPSTLKRKLNELKEFFDAIGTELQSHLVKPIPVLHELTERFLANLPEELNEINVNISLNMQVIEDTIIIIDRALFQDILSNILSNLKHAIDNQTQSVDVELSIYRNLGQVDSKVCIKARCLTRGAVYNEGESINSTTLHFGKIANSYGVELIIPEECKIDKTVPWDETWCFWGI